jgi:hypothetical protein
VAAQGIDFQDVLSGRRSLAPQIPRECSPRCDAPTPALRQYPDLLQKAALMESPGRPGSALR